MPPAAPGWLSALSGFAFLAVALLYVPAGLLSHYAVLVARPLRVSLLATITACFAAAFFNEWFWRGWFYDRVQKTRLSVGLPSLITALFGMLIPLAARLELFPSDRISPFVTAGHAVFVEVLLSLGLTWMSLGTKSPLTGSLALGALWSVRMGLEPRYHGGVFPMLELWAALFAAPAVALVLHRPLAPFREELLGGE